MPQSSYPSQHLNTTPGEMFSQQSPPTRIDELPFCGVWRREDGRKIPYNPVTGQRAKSNDASTFGTRAQADRALATGKYQGLCVLVDESLGITGGDLDHVIPEADAFNEAALPPDVMRIIRIADTYTTWSPSGTGIRFFFATVAPTYKSSNKSSPSRKVCTAEAYRRLRFMTDTEIHITGTPDVFNTDANTLEAWYEALGFEKRETEQPRPVPPPSTPASSNHLTLDDLLTRAFNAKNGDAIRRLHEGDIGDYPQSQSDPGFSSEADLALVGYLCFWTHDDDLVAEAMRSSGLSRKKLDRRDYIDRTIRRVRTSQTAWWDPNYGSSAPTPMIVPPIAEGASCDERLQHAQATIMLLTAQLQDARQTIGTLQERARLADEREAIQRNAKLGASRQTAAALAGLFQEERPREPGTPTPYRMPLAKLAERTGLSADTCSQHLKKLSSYRTPNGDPVLHAETRDILRSENQETGEITEPHREVWVGPAVDRSAFGHILAQLAPANAPEHGGRPDRNACPQHPDAGVLRRTKTSRKITRECAHCHLVLDVVVIPVGPESREHIPTTRPMPHHAFRHGFDDSGTTDPIQHDAFGSVSDPGPMPQHALSIDNPTGVGEDLSGKMRHSPRPIADEPSDSWVPPDWGDEHRYRPAVGEVAGHDRWSA
jgi:hypothetical protein